MRYLSLFSGIEAASVAWQNIPGWEPVAFCEFAKFPSAVLAHHFPAVPNLGDITQVDWKEVTDKYGAVDLIVGGSPCQSFSIAAGASRTSLNGKSNLMWEYIRAIKDVKPRWVLWENVPGVLNTHDDAFGCLLRALQESGYCDIAWRVLDAQYGTFTEDAGAREAAAAMGDGDLNAPICMAGDNSKAAIDVDLCGTLLAGGGLPIVLQEH